MNTKDEPVHGTVQEALPDLRYRVVLDSGELILCYLAGKMRFHRINVIIGDKVLLVLDKYGGKSTNRIVRRL